MTLELKYRDKLMQGREEGRNQGIAEGLAEGSHSAKLEMARSMIADNFPDSTITKHTGLSVEEIQTLK